MRMETYIALMLVAMAAVFFIWNWLLERKTLEAKTPLVKDEPVTSIEVDQAERKMDLQLDRQSLKAEDGISDLHLESVNNQRKHYGLPPLSKGEVGLPSMGPPIPPPSEYMADKLAPPPERKPLYIYYSEKSDNQFICDEHGVVVGITQVGDIERIYFSGVKLPNDAVYIGEL